MSSDSAPVPDSKTVTLATLAENFFHWIDEKKTGTISVADIHKKYTQAYRQQLSEKPPGVPLMIHLSASINAFIDNPTNASVSMNLSQFKVNVNAE